ncbi:PREDICTED: 50S ribosomal protein L24-like [Fragaria vesca subsp. vesca]
MGWKAAEKLIRHWKVLRGDNVMIIRGKDKGETGIIKQVIRSQNRVIVEGKNLVSVLLYYCPILLETSNGFRLQM